MTEQQWEKKLKINTTGRDASHADAYRYPYEPTPYSVLERLADSGFLGPDNIVVDYGCGRGRVGFFLSYRVGCRSIGIEYDGVVYAQAVENRRTFTGKVPVELICDRAEAVSVEGANCFYFFNPFSLEVLQSVFGRILESYYEAPRTMRLLFYYPSEEYRSWLMTRRDLQFLAELDCRDLFDGMDPRERILVFEIA